MQLVRLQVADVQDPDLRRVARDRGGHLLEGALDLAALLCVLKVSAASRVSIWYSAGEWDGTDRDPLVVSRVADEIDLYVHFSAYPHSVE